MLKDAEYDAMRADEKVVLFASCQFAFLTPNRVPLTQADRRAQRSLAGADRELERNSSGDGRMTSSEISE